MQIKRLIESFDFKHWTLLQFDNQILKPRNRIDNRKEEEKSLLSKMEQVIRINDMMSVPRHVKCLFFVLHHSFYPQRGQRVFGATFEFVSLFLCFCGHLHRRMNMPHKMPLLGLSPFIVLRLEVPILGLQGQQQLFQTPFNGTDLKA